MSPAKPVGLTVKIEYQQGIEGNIKRALTKRLGDDGVKIDESQQEAFFKVTGKSGVPELDVCLVVSDSVVWQSTIKEVNALETRFRNAAETQKTKMLDELGSKINDLVPPYFVPRNADDVMLPFALQ